MKKAVQLPLDFPKVTVFGSDYFYISSSNRLAANIIETYPDWPYFAQIIYGEHGCGKTHLVNILKEKTDDITYVNGRDLKEIFQPQTGTLVIDDIDEADEKALFHAYNIMKDRGLLLMTASASASRMDIRQPDIRSRLLTVPGIEITAPDDELILALLIKNFNDLGLDIGNECLQFLLKNIERSYGAIHNLIDRANFLSGAYKRKITIPLLKEALGQS